MRRKAEFYYAGNFGKPVYVHGYLTDEQAADRQLLFEVTGSEPESRPKPGLYRAAELPGGWMRLLPDPEVDAARAREVDTTVLQAARAAGFPVTDRP